MCGISGLYSRDQARHDFFRDNIKKYIDSRGPDDFRCVQIDGVSFAHSRLAVRDPKRNHSVQPRKTNSERYLYVFNGEIYNINRIKEKYRIGKECMYSDTCLLGVLFDKFGIEKTLQIIVGMFSIAVIDNNKKLMYLTRDSLGEKPLYYLSTGDQLIFSSESDFISENFHCGIDYEAIKLYEAFGFVPAPKTLYLGLKKILPAQLITINFKEQDLKISYSFIKPTNLIPWNSYQANRNNAVDQVLDDQNMALALSAGIDSSYIALFLKERGVDYCAYTVDISGQEVDYARKLTKKLRVEHKIIDFDVDAFDQSVSDYRRAFSDPIGDPSVLPTLALAREIHNNQHKVVITGDGADELFGGYTRYKIFDRLNFFRKVFHGSSIGKALVMRLITNITKSVARRRSSIEKIVKFLQSEDELQAYLILFSRTSDMSVIDNVVLWLNTHRTEVEKALDFDLKVYLSDNIFSKSDKSYMYYSLESRTPYSVFTKDEQQSLGKLYYGKQELRSELLRFGDENKEIINREKMGFGMSSATFLADKKVYSGIFNEINESTFIRQHFQKDLVTESQKIKDGRPLNFTKLFKYYSVALWAQDRGL